jgi:DNA-binding transcriptional LysR family regulator
LKKHLSLEDLVDETWVMQAMPSPGRVLLERLFARNEMTRPHKIIECNSMHASLCILKHMPAVALLSEPVARDDLRRKSLLQLPLHLEGNLREYGIVVKRGATLSPMAKEFTQAIQQAAVGFFL